MTARIIDGKKIASEIKESLREEVKKLKSEGVIPGLAVLICGNDSASQIYVRNKEKTAKELGMNSLVYEFLENAGENEVLETIEKLNVDKGVNGILVQLPLPSQIDEKKVIEAIDPKKDVDCFHPENVGKMMIGGAKLFPCTPAGIIEILERNDIEISGKECVVVGRSNIVGKPMALMLLEKNGTVTVAHSKTENLKEVCLRADILVSAVGKAGIITADMVKNGAVVIDVGMNHDSSGKLLGDVDFDSVKEKAAAITPVPGGVGPMTIAYLMKNVISLTRGWDDEEFTSKL